MVPTPVYSTRPDEKIPDSKSSGMTQPYRESVPDIFLARTYEEIHGDSQGARNPACICIRYGGDHGTLSGQGGGRDGTRVEIGVDLSVPHRLIREIDLRQLDVG